jgi:hypothetical protein
VQRWSLLDPDDVDDAAPGNVLAFALQHRKVARVELLIVRLGRLRQGQLLLQHEQELGYAVCRRSCHVLQRVLVSLMHVLLERGGDEVAKRRHAGGNVRR